MKLRNTWSLTLAGAAAGAVNGLLGAGGGMVLVPLLTLWASLSEEAVFPASVSIILPICLVSLAFSPAGDFPQFSALLSFLLGSLAGGLAAGLWGKKIPTIWLHRALGALILMGGIRNLC